MSAKRPVQMVLVAASALTVLAAAPGQAEAQRRGGGRPVVVRPAPVRPVVFVRSYYARPWFYDPWYQWGPYRYPPYGYGYLRGEMSSALRIEVSPRDAQVYVDGYLAGPVDDFDGVFQRLHVPPGGHEIVVYMEGYRTIRRNVYLGPGSTQHIRETMERLGPGESTEPPPVPSDVAAGEDADPAAASQVPGRRTRPAPPDTREAPVRFGTLSIRVQPADAEITIDGDRWNPASGDDRVSIRLAEGRHRLEVRKDGYAPYVEEVLIRRGSTLTLNVSLSRSPAQ